jgi:hypothetical protein
MARIRTIKPQFWQDAGVANLSREARLLMLGLVSIADDEGRFVASPAAIIGYVYPHDDDVTPAKVKRWLSEVEKHCHLTLYTVDGLSYGSWRNWTKHQAINRPSSSPLPPPLTEESLNAHGGPDE